MRIYTVHLRRHGLHPDRDFVLVPEGFSWLAFLFGPLWSLFKGLWFVTGLIVGMEVVLAAVLQAMTSNPVIEAAAQLGLAVVIGYLANDFWRWTLGGRGFNEAGVVGAQDRDAASRRYLDHHPELAREFAL